MWNNAEWAQAHIRKKHPDVSIEEAWEVYLDSNSRSLISPDQLHYSPYRRYWKIGKTKSSKRLLIAWAQLKEVRNLITAYPPSEGQMKRKLKKEKAIDVKRWEEAAVIFEDPSQFEKIAKKSRVLTATEERELLGPGRTKQISIRLPETDLQAVKEIASATDRPYQQLVVVAVQQYIDRISSSLIKFRR